MIRSLLKRLLHYRPLDATAVVRSFLDRVRTSDRPYCPDSEGDLIWSMIAKYGYRNCLETGFGTGSTAIYMLDATKANAGRVFSIDWSESQFNDIGRRNIERYGADGRHLLIEEPSWQVFPRLLTAGQQLDFVFIDGWKTFDYLVYELFIINRMLAVGGAIMFDDSYLPSVGKAIAVLKSHYGYREIEYGQYGQTFRLRLFHILTRRGLRRPYRALRKMLATEDQAPTRDWTFYRRF
jgi:predicted O-methyltransferase YrrM